MSWAGGTLFAFDTETTGVDAFNDRIITAALVKVVDGQVADSHDWAIAPEIEVSEGAFKAHGISTEQARAQGGPPAPILDDISRDVSAVLRSGYPLVVFNAAFDLTLLEAECQRHTVYTVGARLSNPGQWQAVVDPMVICKGLDVDNRDFAKGRKYTLPFTCERFGVEFTETHDAIADATGAALLTIALAQKFNALPSLGPAELHARQVAWRRRDQASFRNWIAKQTPEKQATYGDVDDGWPLHSRLQAVSA